MRSSRLRFPILAVAGTLVGGLGPACGDRGSGELVVGAEGGSRTGGSGTRPEVFCRSDKDCTERGLLCDDTRLVCVDCIDDSDCEGDALCTRGACAAIVRCDSTRDCSADEVCSDDLGYCVECETDADCADSQTCLDTACLETCDSDKDCAKLDALCAPEIEVCVACFRDSHCADDEYCDVTGTCTARVCNPGEAFCDRDLSTRCDDVGSGFVSRSCDDCDTRTGLCEGDDAECPRRTEDCPCGDDDSCDSGLECNEQVCVAGTGGSTGAGGTGGMDGANGDGGNSGGDTGGQGGTGGSGGNGAGGTGDGPLVGSGTYTFGERPTCDFQGVTTDADLQGNNPTNNFGATADIASDADPPRVGLLRFDLSALGTGLTVESATLRVWTLDCSGCEANVNTKMHLYEVLEAWQEGDLQNGPGAVSWKERLPGVDWLSPGVEPPSRGTAVQAEWWPQAISTEYEVILPPALVQKWVDQPADNNGVLFKTSPYSNDGVNFWTSEYETVERRPQLDVTVTVP